LGAVKGTVVNLSTRTKVLIVHCPVVLLVALVGLLVLAILAAVRSAPTHS
jgi:hypothetical protein